MKNSLDRCLTVQEEMKYRHYWKWLKTKCENKVEQTLNETWRCLKFNLIKILESLSVPNESS